MTTRDRTDGIDQRNQHQSESQCGHRDPRGEAQTSEMEAEGQRRCTYSNEDQDGGSEKLSK